MARLSLSLCLLLSLVVYCLADCAGSSCKDLEINEPLRAIHPRFVKREAAKPDAKDGAAKDYEYLEDEDGYDDEQAQNDDGDEDDEDDGEEDDEDASYTDEDEAKKSTGPITMLSDPVNLIVKLNSSVWLPCTIQNEENAVVTWKKNKDQNLYMGTRLDVEPRFVFFKNRTMAIFGVQEQDYDSYTCSAIKQHNENVEVVHRLIAPVAPKVVNMLPLGREADLPEGKPLKIQCLAKGEPKPKITWTREGSRLTTEIAEFGEQSLYIKSVSRNDSGVYQCMASNGIGTPDVGRVIINVLHVPEVHVRKSVINTDEGYEAIMDCSVKAKPMPVIMWKKDGETVFDSHHHHITQNEDRTHSHLKIKKVTKSDFGKYTCLAKNEIGTNEAHAVLVRQPGRALWVTGSQNNNYNPVLHWDVESVQPITEIELRYFKIDQSKPNMTPSEEDWTVIKPDITQPEGNIYSVKHALVDLAPGKYAAQVRAKNTHGWSELSEKHYFEGAFDSNDVSADMKDSNDGPKVAEITGGSTRLGVSLVLTSVMCALVSLL